MKLHVYHRTEYRYAAPVRESFNEARLQPVTADGQACHNFMLKVLPATRVTHYADFLQNCVHVFDVSEPHTQLSVEAVSTVTTSRDRLLSANQATVPVSAMPGREMLDGHHDLLGASKYVDAPADALSIAAALVAPTEDVWQACQILMGFVHREFTYKPASTHVHTPISEVLKDRCGVCQDFAHVTIGLCRALKIPARYVSGYLYNGPIDQLRGAQASHAWIEVFLPGFGWRGLDPTNRQQVDERYVKLAAGRDYGDVSPLRGTYRGTAQRKLTVEVLVSAVEERAA